MRDPVALLRVRRRLRVVVDAVKPDWLMANSPQGFLYARAAVLFGPSRVGLYYMAARRH